MPRSPINPEESSRLAAAAEKYGVSVKTAGRWAAAGGADPAPLEDPAGMLAWWERMRTAGIYSQKCPRSIRAVAPASVPATVHLAPVANHQLKDYLADMQGRAFDYSESLSGAELMVRTTRFLLQQALDTGATSDLPILHSQLRDAQEAYRVAKRDEAKILDASGVTLPKDIIRREMLALHANIIRRFRQGLRSNYDPARLALTSPESWANFTDTIIDSICSDLLTTRFAILPAPSSAPPPSPTSPHHAATAANAA